MKRLLFLPVILIMAVACVAQTSWQQIPIPPLPAFKPQEPKRIELPNGMVIFLQEDHELPLIDGVMRIRGGSRSEPANKVGMLDIYGEVWRTGGTKTQTGDQLDDFLEARAAKVESGNNADSTTISLSCLKEDFDGVFKVFQDLLRQPEFRADKVDLAQKEMFDGISRRNDDVGEIAGRESTKLAYGATNPYARVEEYATVAAVTRQDLLDWHHAHVHPNHIILGLVGDFDSAQMEVKLRQAFGEWPKGPALQEDKIVFQTAKPGYYLIHKEDVNQSNIRMVALGIKRDNPDYYAVTVLNEAFGGGFASRLTQHIRTEKGLAYSVGGGVGTAFDHPGILRLGIGTKSESTVEAIQALYDEIDGLSKNPISDAEIKQAKDSILNGFVFNFDSPDKVLRERMAYEFYGYPADFLEQYRDKIEKVTKAEVQQAAAKYLHKDQMAVLVVGNAADFDKPLSSLGPVTNVDITIPPPPGQEPPPAAKPSASNSEGKALAAKVVAAMGGEARLKAIKALHIKSELTQKGPEGDVGMPVETTIVFPDRMRAQLGASQAITMVVSPQGGFLNVGPASQDLPPAQRAETLAQIKRDPIYIGQHLNDPGFSFTASGAEKIGDVEARMLDVSGDGVAMKWYVDPASGRILRETYQAMGQ